VSAKAIDLVSIFSLEFPALRLVPNHRGPDSRIFISFRVFFPVRPILMPIKNRVPFIVLAMASAVAICASPAPANTNAPTKSSSSLAALQKSNEKPTRDNPRWLKSGDSLRTDIAGREVHTFRVSLLRGQYLHAVIQQLGIDVIVALIDPDDKEILTMDSPSHKSGPESVSVVATVAGDYKVEVRVGDPLAAAGNYEISLEEIREATKEDSMRAQAEQYFASANGLLAKGAGDSLRKAADDYKDALKLWTNLNDIYGRGYTLCNLGRVYRGLGDLSKSLDYLQQALSIWRESGKKEEQAFVLNEIGASYREFGKPTDALGSYDQALVLRREINNQSGEAQVLNNIGLIYARTGSFQKATDYYTQAITILVKIEDRRQEAISRNNLAGALDELGDTKNALENYGLALGFTEQAGNKSLQALIANNRGKIYDTQGDFQKAQESYETALDIYKNLKDQNGEALVLDNMGMLYATRGDPQTALQFFNSALPLREEVKRPRGIANTRQNLGFAYSLLGEFQKALENFEAARKLREQIDDSAGLSTTLTSLGRVYLDLDSPQKALEYFQRALALNEKSANLRGQAIALNRIGQTYLATGDLSKAQESYNRAIPLFQSSADRPGEAMALFGLANVESSQGKLDTAMRHVEDAIKIVEPLRSTVTSQKLRLIYFATKQDYYHLAIELRMKLHRLKPQDGNDATALVISERARARDLVDMLEVTRSDIRQGVNPKLIEEEQTLAGELDARAESLIRSRSSGRTDDSTFLAKQIQELMTKYDRLQSTISRQSSAYSALIQPQSISLDDIQHLLDDNTILLEYSLGEEQSYLWIVSRNRSLQTFVLPPRRELEKQIVLLKQLLTARQPVAGETEAEQQQRLRRANAADSDYWSQARELSRLILDPAQAVLGHKRLLIVADGELQYLPFAALPAPRPSSSMIAKAGFGHQRTAPGAIVPLMVDHEIVNLPSASTLVALQRESLRRKPAPKAVAILADPVFELADSRLTAVTSNAAQASIRNNGVIQRSNPAIRDQGIRLGRLLSSAQEAREITSLVPSSQRFLATGFAATRSAALSSKLKEYRIIHFATHGILDDEFPDLSGIALSQFDKQGQRQANGFLRLHDIYNLNLPADLVVLSACNTALGKRINGEGLIGLTRGFMYAGATRVVSSLWQADDASTAELMGRFYRHMLKERMTPAAALRSAQIDLWKELPDRSPYFWGAFIIQGEWR
jgi:CHAT domain-containing protein/tetratricopeptide (TPR) repeat protein